MTALVKHRDLLSAGLALGFVVFVLASVVAKTLVPPANADHSNADLGHAATAIPAAP